MGLGRAGLEIGEPVANTDLQSLVHRALQPCPRERPSSRRVGPSRRCPCGGSVSEWLPLPRPKALIRPRRRAGPVETDTRKHPAGGASCLTQTRRNGAAGWRFRLRAPVVPGWGPLERGGRGLDTPAAG